MLIMEYRKIVEVEFREYDRETLDKSWEWLNDPETKELTMIGDFDREYQLKWFEGLKDRKNFYIRSVICKGEIIGACGLKKITNEDGEIWGYIGEKKYWGKTVGAQMMEHIIQYAQSLNLSSIYAVYLKTNRPSIKTSKRFGFVYEKDINENEILMRLSF